MRRKTTYFERVVGSPEPVSVGIARRVLLSEVDVLGIVWHGRYPIYFEEASTNLGRKCGLTYDAFREAGIGAPIVQFHIDYHRPLLLDESFTVTASYVWTDALKLLTEFRIALADGVIACTGYTTQLFMDLSTREALWAPPPIWERFTTRWRSGELHG